MSKSITSCFLILAIALLFSCDNTNYKQGQLLYESNCATCHMPDGTGVSKLYPSLNNIKNNDINIINLPCIIRHGQNKEEYLLEMEGLDHLTDIEINNIINYILNDLNKFDKEYQIDETRMILTQCENKS